MLINFRVANFRSLKEPQELDLRPVYRDGPESLNVCAVYGANASGKSNVLRALEFMHNAVTDQGGWNMRNRIHLTPFLLDRESAEQPTSFAVELDIEGVKYAYGFSATQERITEEWLHSFPKKKKRVLFERDGDTYYFGPSFASARAEVIREITPATSLYISTASKANHDTSTGAVHSWFVRHLWFADDTEDSRSFQRGNTLALLRSEEKKGRVERLIKAADLGISETRIEEIEFREDPAAEDRGIRPAFHISYESGKATVLYRGERPELPPRLLAHLEAESALTFRHRGSAEHDFTLDDQSRGTRTWFDISGMVVRALDEGNTLVVDELDTSLHPLLLAQMIKLFQRRDSNPRGAQLVFTTHDASLMGRNRGEELLRRDEIWFTQKNAETGSTELYPLTDFKPRDGLNWEKRYLGGSVGGVPYISETGFEEALSRP
ncbi:AAA family ATPase [Streptomyces tsukubensis]|uniref:AAA family ATPase n=1 Tax=Streptomyces tsukubensis TaxID=83656 RepID=UPI0034508EDA